MAFLIVCFVGHGRGQIDHLRVFIDPQDVLIRVRFLFAAIVCVLLGFCLVDVDVVRFRQSLG